MNTGARDQASARSGGGATKATAWRDGTATPLSRGTSRSTHAPAATTSTSPRWVAAPTRTVAVSGSTASTRAPAWKRTPRPARWTTRSVRMRMGNSTPAPSAS